MHSVQNNEEEEIIMDTFHDKEAVIPLRVREIIDFVKVGSAIFLSSALVTTVDVNYNSIKLWLLWGFGIGLFFLYIILVHAIANCVVNDVKNNKNSKYMQMIKNSQLHHHHHQHFPEEGIEILTHVHNKNKQNKNTVMSAKIDSSN